MATNALFACLLNLALGPLALAQEIEAINTERPGFSSSPITLSPLVLQVEGGYQFSHDSGSGDFDDHSLPLMLVRLGLVDRLELQLGWSGYSWSESAGRHVNGRNDASIGVKWQVSDADATVPLGLFAGVSLPTGDDAFSSDSFDPTLGAFWSYSRGMDWYGTVLLSDSDSDSSISNAVGVRLPIDATTGSFLEYVSQFGMDGGDEHYLNSGFTYLPRNDIQVDLNFGAGLNSRATDFYVGVGLAHRF